MEILARSLASTGCDFYEFQPGRTVAYLKEIKLDVPNLEERMKQYGLIVFDLTFEDYTELTAWVAQWNQSFPQMTATLRVENFVADSCLVVGEYADDLPKFSSGNSPQPSEMSLDDDGESDDSITVDVSWAQTLIPEDQRGEELDPIAILQIQSQTREVHPPRM